MITKLLRNVIPNSLHFKIPRGQAKGLNWITTSANLRQALGVYEPDLEPAFISAFKNSQCFWDVGANVGWYTLMAAKFMPGSGKIYSFEPNPENIRVLRKHIELNHLQQVELVEKAMGEKSGEARFGGTHQTGRLSEDGDLVVEITTADAFTTAQNIPDLIKLDIEGAELDFLKGAEKLLEQHRPTLIVAAHGFNNWETTTQFLQQRKYNIKELMYISTQQTGDYTYLAQPETAG